MHPQRLASRPATLSDLDALTLLRQSQAIDYAEEDWRRWLRDELPALQRAVAGESWLVSLSRSSRIMRRSPICPIAGESLHGNTPWRRPTPGCVRIGTWNIHGGQGRDDRRDLNRTASALGDLDVVGLNEVRHDPGQPDQCQQLAERLQMRWLFAPSERRWCRNAYGNGLLSRLPITRWIRLPLPRGPVKSCRSVLFARLPWGKTALTLVVTHLAYHQASMQLAALAPHFLALKPPAILLGDCNVVRDSNPAVQRLAGAAGVRQPLAEIFGRWNWIDRIFTRGLEVRNAVTQASDASDHPLLWCELAVRGQNAARAA